MPSSGSEAFDRLRDHLTSDLEVKREVEFAFAALLNAANPSDRGLRFLFGGGAEWILAAAAWSAGVLTSPQGHGANGFDLNDLLEQAQGLWSVKASANPKPAPVRLKNFMGDGRNQQWQEPTVFLGPYLGGAVFVDPRLNPSLTDHVKRPGDALELPIQVVKRFGEENPLNFIEFDVKANKGQQIGDRFTFIKSIITPAHFPRLSKPFTAALPNTRPRNRIEEVEKLNELYRRGELSKEAFTSLAQVWLDA